MGLAQWMPALLICAGLGFWAWRLRLRNPASGPMNLANLGAVQLGPSQRLVAVRAANRVYLLAVSGQNVAPIAELDLQEWLAGPGAAPASGEKATGQGAGS